MLIDYLSPPLAQESPQPFAGSPLRYIRERRRDKPQPSDENIGGSIQEEKIDQRNQKLVGGIQIKNKNEN